MATRRSAIANGSGPWGRPTSPSTARRPRAAKPSTPCCTLTARPAPRAGSTRSSVRGGAAMYRYDAIDKAMLADRVAEFREQCERRLSGELTEDQFKRLRLMNGLYLQLHAY